MKNQTLQAMVLNAGLEMELNPDQKPKRYEQLLKEVKQLFGCSKTEAIKIIHLNSLNIDWP